MAVVPADGFDSYIIGLREHARPRALRWLYPGAEVRLRPSSGRGPRRLEVCTPEGEPLGWLPVEDSMGLNEAGAWLRGQVTALVPARLLPRVHIRVFTEG